MENRYYIKIRDCNGERNGTFIAKSPEQACKRAKKYFNLYGECECTAKIIDN